MKIALVDPAAYSLPYDDALAAALGARGHDVTLFTTRFAHGAMPEPDGYELVEWFYRRHLPGLPRRVSRALQHPRDLLHLARTVREQGFDVTHAQWLPTRADAPAYRRFDGARVLTAHNALPREDARELGCDQLRSFDAVVAHSADGARALRERCTATPVWHVPHGALDAYRDAPPADPAPLQLEDGPVVALPGLLRPYKGVNVLLEAWPAVRERVPGAQLVVAGRPMGVDLPETPPAGVHLLARFLDDADFAWILRRADIVCLPYTSIDLSGVLFSALALGRPLVLSDVGGFRDFAGHGARLVPPGDAPALALALAELLADATALERLAQESRAAADRDYSWSAIAAQYETHYEQLLAQRAGV